MTISVVETAINMGPVSWNKSVFLRKETSTHTPPNYCTLLPSWCSPTEKKLQWLFLILTHLLSLSSQTFRYIVESSLASINDYSHAGKIQTNVETSARTEETAFQECDDMQNDGIREWLKKYKNLHPN